MTMKFTIEGIIPAMVTPFTKGGKSVDFEKAAALAARLADRKVHGLFVCGTTGEGMLLTLAERKQMVETVVRAVGKRVKVIAHTGCFDTASTIELTQHAAEAGTTAAGVVAPGFHGYDDSALKAHFLSVARSVPGFPILLYNIPSCARNGLSVDLIKDLASETENIVGMKDSGGSIVHLNAVLSAVPKGFRVINGVDEYTCQAYVAGACGSVSSTANVTSHLFLAIFDNFRKGKLAEAWEAQRKLSRACSLFRYGAMVAFYKEGLRMQGFDPGYVRPPQRELTSAERKAFHKDMEKAGLI